MIFAETDRLILRPLRKSDLPRMVELLNVWDVVRWMSVIPFPYAQSDAESFYEEVCAQYARQAPELYMLALKKDDLLIGAIGLHLPRNATHADGEIETGYWLGHDFWGQGLLSEAFRETLKIGFASGATRMIGANTSLNNKASQNVLRKAGFADLGIFPRDYAALRGDNHIIKWRLTRQAYEQGQNL